MGGVDIAGQRCKTYMFPHRSRKWYPRLVDYLLSIVFVNSHIIFTSVDGKEKKILKLFIEEMCITFLEGFLRRTAHSQFKEIFPKDLQNDTGLTKPTPERNVWYAAIGGMKSEFEHHLFVVI